ncbi:MAG: hypothetical protein AABX83_00020 [Nanoarchaeota archaeon]
MELKEGELVLCTVKKIDKTTIFLDIEDYGEGGMVLSEVAAGRIRNLRDYVSINKKIVCKVLKIENNHIELSLRRVTGKEKELVLDKHKREKSLIKMLETIIKNPAQIIKEIKEEYSLVNFFEEALNSPELLKKFFSKEEIEKLTKILTEKTDKEKTVKKLFKLSSSSNYGLIEIKEILNIPEVEINYLGSSKFSISAKAKDFKEANKKLTLALEQIQHKAKQKNAQFEIIEK